MKILIFNLNVGSGIEYAGNIFIKWAREAGHEVKDYKHQTSEVNMIDDVTKFKPDIIVINETYDRVMHSCFYYKYFFPKVKIITLLHSWNFLVDFFEEGHVQDTLMMAAIKDSDYLFLLNCRPEGIKYHEILERKVVNAFMPVDPKIFINTTPHNQRKKKFCCIGTLNDLKFSSTFIKEVGEDIQIDLYGGEPKDQDYIELLKSKPNLVYKGMLSQDDVPVILNEYQYYVLPHSKTELFNISLLQAIFCGTIPLVWNKKQQSPWWLHWGEGLIFHTEDIHDFIENLRKLQIDSQDMTVISQEITRTAQTRFDFEGLKEKFIFALKS